MPTYRVNVEIYVVANDPDDAGDWIVSEVFPIARDDNPVMAIAYEPAEIVQVSEDDLSPIKEETE